MRVAEFLRINSRATPVVSPGTSVREVLRTFRIYNVSAVIVRDESGSLDGIVAERDIARAAEIHEPDLLDLPVAAVSTTAAISCSLTDQITDVAKLMAERSICHVAVRDHGRVSDVVGILDILAQRLDDRRRVARAFSGLAMHA